MSQKSLPETPAGGFKHTMLDPQFGRLVPDDFPDERDAIHIACAAGFAAEDLEPGDHITFAGRDNHQFCKASIAPIGIVDPFLRETVKKGQRFWVFLYPGSISSLRHNWSHPAFDMRAQATAQLLEGPAKRRMRAFAASLPHIGAEEDWNDKTGQYEVVVEGEPITFEMLIDRATSYATTGDYWSEGGAFEGQGLYEEFWDDFKELTGIDVPEGDRYSFFTCAC